MKQEEGEQEQVPGELDAMRQRIDELEALRRRGLQLSSSLDLSAVLNAIAESAVELVGASDCVIYLYDEATAIFSFGTAFGRWEDVGTVLAPRADGLTATVVRERRPVVIEDAAHHPLYASPEARRWSIQSIAGFPLCEAGRVLGVLHVVFARPHAFPEDELRILGLLADQAASAIENALLYARAQHEIAVRAQAEEELRRHRDHLEELVAERTAALTAANSRLQREIAERKQAEAERERLLAAERAQARRQAALFRLSADLAAAPDEAAVCSRVVDDLWNTLGYDYVALFLVDPATGDRVLASSITSDEPPTRLAPGQGLSEGPLLDGQLHYTADVTQDPHYVHGLGGSEVDVPIRVSGRMQGILAAENRHPNAFRQEDFEVLTAASQQAGLAIEKARLFGEIERRVTELATLTEVGKALSSTLRMDEVLQLIFDQTRRVMYAEGMLILLYDEAQRELECVFSTNPDDLAVGTRFPDDAGLVGAHIVQRRESLLLKNDVTKRAGDLGLELAGQPAASWLGVPMRRAERVLGAIVVQHYTKPDLYDEHHQVLLESIASQAAYAIENARLFEQAQREIAERRRAEAELQQYQERLEELVAARTVELRESEGRYRTLFDGVPVGLYRSKPSGEVVDANLALVEMMGFPSRESYLAVNLADLYVEPADRERWQALMEQAGVVRDFETRLRRHDGTVIWADDTARAVRDPQGQVLYYEGSLEDITARKEAEAKLGGYREHLEELVQARTAELRASEERYRTLFDGVPVGLYRTTPAGQFLDVNRAFVQMSGCPDRQTLLSLNTGSLYVDPEEQARWRALMEGQGVVRDFETQARRYDGTLLWFKDTARAVRDEQGRVLYYEGSLEDITQRKQFEEEVRRQKDYYEALFVNSPVAVVTADLAGKVVSWNPMAERLLGYKQEEVIGRQLDDLVAHDPGLRAEAQAYTDQVISAGRVQVTTRRTRKDGSMVDVELLALPVVVAGKKVGFIIIYVDITDLLEARRQAEAASEAKGTFLANMSHELRTPLNAILGFSQLMDGDPNLTAVQQENLGIINRSGEHLLALINDVLEMSKIEAGRVILRETSFDLHGLLDTLEEMFRLRAEGKGLALSLLRSDELPRSVVGDEGKLRQVLSNLLGNAVKFTRQGSVQLRADVLSPAHPCPPGRALLHFEVEDTGPGIAPRDLERVFEPFVQASGSDAVAPGTQEGTGLGLTISRQFVRLMGGTITASSELAQGSLFRFDVEVGLAAAELESAHPQRRVAGLAPDQRAADGRPFRLLVVEDKETNRRLLVQLLAAWGFEVREAANGQEALEMWEQWQPHLIWMDMRMPVMDGHEATRRIKATPLGRVTVVIALTATAFEEDREQILLEGCDDFVRKPIRKEEICTILAKHLGVRFVCEEERPAPLLAGATRTVPPPVVEALAALPAALLADLRQATTKADLPLILHLAGQIRERNAALADHLAQLAGDYEYKKILALIKQAGGQR